MERKERLKWARARKFPTVSAAARALGISNSTYTAHENGGRVFCYDDCEAYARRFKVPVEWLAFGVGRPDDGFKETQPAFPWPVWEALSPKNRKTVTILMKSLVDEQQEEVEKPETHGFVSRAPTDAEPKSPSGKSKTIRSARKSKGG